MKLRKNVVNCLFVDVLYNNILVDHIFMFQGDVFIWLCITVLQGDVPFWLCYGVMYLFYCVTWWHTYLTVLQGDIPTWLCVTGWYTYLTMLQGDVLTWPCVTGWHTYLTVCYMVRYLLDCVSEWCIYLATFRRTVASTWGTRNSTSSVTHCSSLCWSIRRPWCDRTSTRPTKSYPQFQRSSVLVLHTSLRSR